MHAVHGTWRVVHVHYDGVPETAALRVVARWREILIRLTISNLAQIHLRSDPRSFPQPLVTNDLYLNSLLGQNSHHARNLQVEPQRRH